MADPVLARDIMTTEVITVSPDDDVEKVARLLLEHQISGLPVIDGGGKLVGVISEGDLVGREKEFKGPSYTVFLGAVIYLERPQRFLDELKRTIALKVSELMSSKKIYMVGPESTVEEVATIIVEKGINRVPVVDGEHKLLGIITRQDILKSTYSR